jgi:hypothetical protein
MKHFLLAVSLSFFTALDAFQPPFVTLRPSKSTSVGTGRTILPLLPRRLENDGRRAGAVCKMISDKDKDLEQEGTVTAAVADGFYFATKVSDNGNAQLFYHLVRNQFFLGLSCIWTLSVIDPQSDPTFFSTTVFDFSLFPVFLGIVSSVPLVAGGLAISRSQSRTWVDINGATNQLVKTGVCVCECVWGVPCVPE